MIKLHRSIGPASEADSNDFKGKVGLGFRNFRLLDPQASHLHIKQFPEKCAVRPCGQEQSFCSGLHSKQAQSSRKLGRLC